MDSLRNEFKDKKVLIVGLGLLGGGVGLVSFFSELGAKVRVTDLKSEEELKESLHKLSDVSFEKSFGEPKEEDFTWADVIFKGPSVRWDNPHISKAIERGARVEMEMSFFVKHCPAQIVGVTGTRGKSTTSTLIYEILKASGKDAYLAGNVAGTSTIELLKTVSKNSIVVLELSSWALSAFHRDKLSPHTAVFTNFYPDHLNYYESEDEYLYDKKAIYLYQNTSDSLITNNQLSKIAQADDYKGHLVIYSTEDISLSTFLKGGHNKENIAAAFATTDTLGIERKTAQGAVRAFKGLPFRLEVVAEKDGVTIINDTTSTTPTAAIKAIQALNDKSVFLIAGGASKGLPFGDLITELAKVEKLYLLPGNFTDELAEKLPSNMVSEQFTSMEEAFAAALIDAKKEKKAYILFSPAATSFAQFKNEFDRGEKFNEIVKKYLS